MKKIKNLLKNNGITLVECIVSMAIVGIASSFLSMGIMAATSMLTKGANVLEYSSDAQEKIEKRLLADEKDPSKTVFDATGIKVYITVNGVDNGEFVSMNSLYETVDPKTATGIYYKYYRQ